MFSTPVLLAIALVAMAAGLVSQGLLRTAIILYRQVDAQQKTNASQIAREMLDGAGLRLVGISIASGRIPEGYNSEKGSVLLSRQTYVGTDIASLAMACHECGHAQFDSMAAPSGRLIHPAVLSIAQIAESLWLPLLVIAVLLQAEPLQVFAIAVLACSLACQIPILVQELKASHLALQFLEPRLKPALQKKARIILLLSALTYLSVALSGLRLPIDCIRYFLRS